MMPIIKKMEECNSMSNVFLINKSRILLIFIILFSIQSIHAQLNTEILDSKFINLFVTRDSNLIESTEFGEPNLAFYLCVQVVNSTPFPVKININTFRIIIKNEDSIQLYVCSGETILSDEEHCFLEIASNSTIFFDLYTVSSTSKLRIGKRLIYDDEYKDYPKTTRFLNKKSALIFEYWEKEEKIVEIEKISNFQSIIERNAKNQFFENKPCIKKNKYFNRRGW